MATELLLPASNRENDRKPGFLTSRADQNNGGALIWLSLLLLPVKGRSANGQAREPVTRPTKIERKAKREHCLTFTSLIALLS